MAQETRLETHFEFGKNAPKIVKPLPRSELGNLVVANHTTLPAFCVRSGSTQNLTSVTYSTSSGGVIMFLLGGPLAFLFGRKRATIRYSIDRSIHLKLKRTATIANCVLILGILSIVSAFIFSRFYPFALGIVGSIAASILHQTRATPFKITNIWDDEVFISNLNPIVSDAVLSQPKAAE